MGGRVSIVRGFVGALIVPDGNPGDDEDCQHDQRDEDAEGRKEEFFGFSLLFVFIAFLLIFVVAFTFLFVAFLFVFVVAFAFFLAAAVFPLLFGCLVALLQRRGDPFEHGAQIVAERGRSAAFLFLAAGAHGGKRILIKLQPGLKCRAK